MSHVSRSQDPTFSSHQFIQLALDNQVLKFGEFVLKSGRISPYFFNAGLLATGEMLSLLARGYADALAEASKDIKQTTGLWVKRAGGDATCA